MTRLDWSTVTLVIGTILVHTSSAMDEGLWGTYCPNNDFCATGSPAALNTTDVAMEPCCSRCSCEADCWALNNCCPDSRHEKPVDLQAASCSGLHVENNFTSSHFFSVDHYHVFDFCPRDYDVTNSDVIDQCEERFHGNTTLADVVAVSDSRNRIYKNKYCARCHGVHDVQMWALRLTSCGKTVNRLPASQYIRNLLENCIIESVPPGSEIGASVADMLCGPTVTSKCSPDAAITSDIINGCLNGPNVHFRQLFFGETNLHRFKNVFCYLCRDVDVAHVMCPASGGREPTKSTFTSYSLMLDLTTKVKDTAHVTSHPCKETEFYDYAKKRCIPLYCPPYTVLSFGECLKIITSVRDFFVRIRMQYEPTVEHVITDSITSFDDQATNTFINSFVSFYGLSMCYVKEFNVYTFVEKASNILGYVQVEVVLEIDERCKLDDLTRVVRRRLSTSSNISLVINERDVPLAGQIRFYGGEDENNLLNPFDLDRYTDSLVLYKRRPPMFVHYIESGFFLCPYFTLDMQDYNAIINEIYGSESEHVLTEISEATRVEDGFYTLSNDRIAICVDTYFKLYWTSKGKSIMAAPLLILVGVLSTCMTIQSILS